MGASASFIKSTHDASKNGTHARYALVDKSMPLAVNCNPWFASLRPRCWRSDGPDRAPLHRLSARFTRWGFRAAARFEVACLAVALAGPVAHRVVLHYAAPPYCEPPSIVLEGIPGRAAVSISGVVVGEIVAR